MMPARRYRNFIGGWMRMVRIVYGHMMTYVAKVAVKFSLLIIMFPSSDVNCTTTITVGVWDQNVRLWHCLSLVLLGRQANETNTIDINELQFVVV